MTKDVPRRITRDDIESKFRQLLHQADKPVEAAKPGIGVVAVVAGFGLLAVVYLIGTRKGRLRSTVVEIRRS
ncbi:MAG: hypothetical protein M0008_03565 [Actinomycetota bacterium]|jgi:hypothetical protein|nr:hypothetical protein [Actinomycetota bacterium]